MDKRGRLHDFLSVIFFPRVPKVFNGETLVFQKTSTPGDFDA